jgi:hypothetical protein
MTTRPLPRLLPVALALAAGCAHRPASGTAAAAPDPTLLEALSAAVSIAEVAVAPDGGTIAFVSDRTGAPELWTVAATRARRRRG